MKSSLASVPATAPMISIRPHKFSDRRFDSKLTAPTISKITS